jgi:poly [ADP-ribose] polymerase
METDAAGGPLNGFEIAVGGRFGNIDGRNYNADTFERIIWTYGGVFTNSITKATTCLVCTKESLKTSSTKMQAARKEKILLVQPSWLIDIRLKKSKLRVEDYSWPSSETGYCAQVTNNGQEKQKSSFTAVGGDQDATQPYIQSEQSTSIAKSNKKRVKPQGCVTVVPKGERQKGSKSTARLISQGGQRKRTSGGLTVKKKNNITVPLDDYCTLPTYRVWVNQDSDIIYDAYLNLSNCSDNRNKFYCIQVLTDSKSSTFKTWTRWGRVGERGRNAVLGDGTYTNAMFLFKKKFKDKTGHSWEDRSNSPKHKKYAFIERIYKADLKDDGMIVDRKHVMSGDHKKSDQKSPICTLDPTVSELMQLIFNQQHFQQAMSSLKYDATKLPLANLDKATIAKGFQCLKELAALFDDPSLASTIYLTTKVIATERLSNGYYSLIPHTFGRKAPPIIRDDAMLIKELDLLGTLSDMKDATEIMKMERKSTNAIHPLDRQFHRLGLQVLSPVSQNTQEFKHIKNYLNRSRGAAHNMTFDIKTIFCVQREGESKKFVDSHFAKIKSDRRLLWHGSRVTNYGGILSQGLRIAPSEAPASGYMFGKGIYLADMSSKSANYCYHTEYGGEALLLLCEAELGDPIQKLTAANYGAAGDAKKQGMYSTLGQGRIGPSTWIDAAIIHEDLKGIKMVSFLVFFHSRHQPFFITVLAALTIQI